MNTKQVEELTGISRQNIRFYEKMGLLHPAREQQNAYRDYSEDDVERLQYIKFFRMLSISIEDIAKIFDGEVSVEEILRMQVEQLSEKQKEMQGAIRICEQLEKECIGGKKFSATDYLKRMEYEQHTKGGFGGFREDYKNLVAAEGIRQYSFLTEVPVVTTEEMREAIQDNLGDDWYIVKDKDEIFATHGEHSYRINKKKMRTKGKGIPYSTLVILSLEDYKEIAIPAKRKFFLYTLHSVGRNIKTHKWRSILSIALSACMILLLASYTGSIAKIQRQQQMLPQTASIQATVYNQNGTLNDGLLIQDNYVEQLAASTYITKYQEKASLVCLLESDLNEPYKASAWNLVGMQDKMKNYQVEWDEFHDFESFDKSFGVCMVSKDFLKNQKLEIGDSIVVDNSYYTRDDTGFSLCLLPLNHTSLEIVGVYSMTSESGDELPSIILPLNAVKKWYQDEGKRYYANATSFEVKNPEDLNDLKKGLKDIGFVEIQPETASALTGDAIAIEDLEYIETAERLQKSLNLLQSFFILILVLVILVGVIISYLITQSRRNEVIIMRMLGVKRINVVVSYLMEQMGLFVLGTAVAIAVVLLFKLPINVSLVQMIAIFMASYFVGVFTAIGQMIPSQNVRIDHAD